MKTSWKIIFALFFVLAVLLGFSQRRQNYVYNSPFKNQAADSALPDKSLQNYYQAAQDIGQASAQNQTATFLATGDISLTRNVALAITKAGDIDLPFRGMSDILKSTDFNFANLESPFALPGGGVIGGHSMIFGAPNGNIKGLVDNNFKILNLANNHAMDQDLAGLTYTLSLLDQNQIQHEGAGQNLDQAWQPAVVNANGIKVCFIGASYASGNDGGQTRNSYVARVDDLPRLKQAVALAKAECDFTVLTMHAGTEYTRSANSAQTAFAHAAIDDGADMVIGAHPHWVQNIEKYQGRYIFYSLGNFIFDQNWSQDTKEGLALKIQISKSQSANAIAPKAATLDDLQGGRQPAKLDSVELVPVVIENNSTPRPATLDEGKKILKKINQTENILLP